MNGSGCADLWERRGERAGPDARADSEEGVLAAARKKESKKFIAEPLLIPGHNRSLVSGSVLDIPSSHSGLDVMCWKA